MSFTLDGVEIATDPATFVRLACGNDEFELGAVAVGDFVNCRPCGHNHVVAGGEDLPTFCQVAEVVSVEVVPTVHI